MGLFNRFKKAAAVTQPEAPARLADAPCRRGSERFPTTVISCLLGQASDLSITGMRVLSRQAPPVPLGTMFEFEIESPTAAVTVVGRLVRVDKQFSGQYDLGIEFQRLTPELCEAIESLARTGTIKHRRTGNTADGTNVTVSLPDLYAQLGVGLDASDDQIQRAFRERARKCHPDVNDSPDAQQLFVELTRAYEVLRDPEKRAAYDRAFGVRREAA